MGDGDRELRRINSDHFAPKGERHQVGLFVLCASCRQEEEEVKGEKYSGVHVRSGKDSIFGSFKGIFAILDQQINLN